MKELLKQNMKKILMGAGGFVALLLVIVLLVGSNAGAIVKSAVEEFGSAATKTDVSLDNVEISLTDGKGSLEGFEMTNPDGFKTDSAFKIGKISVQINKSSLLGDGPIIVNDVTVVDPEITYEVSNAGSSNLSTIEKNVKEFAAAVAGHASEEAMEEVEDEREEAKEARPITIKRFIVRGGVVHLSHELLKGDDLITAKLPIIRINNIGNSKKGSDPVHVMRIILDRVITEAANVGQSELVQTLKKQGLKSLKAVSEGASEAGEAAKESVQKAGEAAKEAGEAATKSLEDAGDALKSLF